MSEGESVDLRTFGEFQTCFGVNVVDAGCGRFDFDSNGVIDLGDYQSFLAVFVTCPKDFVMSPTEGATVGARRITVFGRLPKWAKGAVVADRVGFNQPDGTYYISDVRLDAGANTLSIVGLDSAGKGVCASTVQVNQVGDFNPLVFRVPSRTDADGLALTVGVELGLTPNWVRIDFDGDGVPETESKGSEATFVYSQAGRFGVWGLLKTSDGLYFSSGLPQQVVVGVPASLVKHVPVVSAVDVELTTKGNRWVLSNTGILRNFDAALEAGPVLTLAGIQSAAAFCVTDDGSFLVVDEGAHKVAKFKEDGSLDTGFGAGGFVGGHGSSLEQFNAPKDVALDASGNVIVADTGNNRLVKLSANGAPIEAIALDASPVGLSHNGPGLYVVSGSESVSVRNRDLREVTQIRFEGMATNGVHDESTMHMVVATSDSDVQVRDMDGRLVFSHAGQPLTSVRGAVLSESTSGVFLDVLNSDGLLRFEIPDESPGESPVAIWALFTNRLASGDVDGAKELVSSTAMTRHLGRLFSALSAEELAAFVNGYGPLQLKRRTESTAYFSAASGGVEAMVVFEREGVRGSWKLVSF